MESLANNQETLESVLDFIDEGLVEIEVINLTPTELENYVNQNIEKRVKEAEKLGFKTCILPEASRKQLKYKGNINIISVGNIAEAIKTCGLKQK